MPRVSKPCAVCHAEFQVWPSAAARRITCSRHCYDIWQSETRTGSANAHWKGGDLVNTCAHCGKEYTFERDRKVSRYCSRKCKDAAAYQLAYGSPVRPMFITRNCTTCGKAFPVERGSNRHYCSVVCQNTGKRLARGAGYESACQQCGQMFWLPNNRKPKTLCCSTNCLHLLHTVETTCAQCGVPFRKPKAHAGYEHDFCCNRHRLNWLNGERRMPTQPERAMKSLLDMLGVRYQFQHPYGVYVLDFALSDLRINIEVDGEYFHEPRQEHDARRDNYMRRHGWKVYRFPSKSLNNIVAARERVTAIIAGTEL